MKNVLVSGSIAYDRIMDFGGNFKDHLMTDMLHVLSVSFTIEKLTESFGGTAGNIAYTLSLLKEPASVLAMAGDDFAKYRTWLEKNLIDCTYVEIVEENPTAAAYIITDRANNQISAFYPGAGKFPSKIQISKQTTDLAILAPSSVSNLENLPGACKDAGVPYFFDPGQQISMLSGGALKNGITGSAGLFGNDYEIKLIQQKTGWSEDEFLEHTALIVVTLGGEGSRIRTKDATWKIAPTPAKAVDPTGAGDAYRAGFIKGYLHNLPLQTCGQLASTTAAYAVEVPGTQNHSFTLAELAQRYSKTYGEDLAI